MPEAVLLGVGQFVELAELVGCLGVFAVVEVDPRKDDLFRVLIERRNALPDKNSPAGRGLKTLANGTSYGIWAEMNRVEQPGARKLPVVVHGQRTLAPADEVHAGRLIESAPAGLPGRAPAALLGILSPSG